MQITLITGLSGSGKSVALHVLEDHGLYCVDNLPASVLAPLIAELQSHGQQSVAVGIDVRSGDTLASLPAEIAKLREAGHDVRVLYLEANDDTLVTRFSETRRRHPLSDGSLTLEECIAREHEILETVGEIGHRIDTSRLSANALKRRVLEVIGLDRSQLTLLFESFAFKHGLPRDADLVFDVRCLPNPHYDPRLRPLTGRDAEVVAFLEAEPDVERMLAHIQAFVTEWLPSYVRDNRSYLTVAVGCTGGRHRSVYLVERLARAFAGHSRVLKRHRDTPDVVERA
ncbi:MAG: RNase adapter RapZ [Proteobacteria bacterium]|nr:RNase adapter RapZ [Burkholderiales bacterium]